MHKRRSIRSAVATAVTGLTLTGANVFKSRVHPTPNKSLPALLVYNGTEESEPGSTGPDRTLDRDYDLVVEGQAKSGDDIDDVLDDIAEDVEEAMDVDRTFGGLCLESYLASTEFGFSGEGRSRAGSVRMTYKFIYDA